MVVVVEKLNWKFFVDDKYLCRLGLIKEKNIFEVLSDMNFI